MPFTYNCSQCNKAFTVHARKHSVNKFCSRKCYHTSQIKTFDIKCRYCNKAYTTLRTDRRYCSRECYLADKEPEMIIKLCPVCNKHFTVAKKYSSRYKVCSFECRTKNTVYAICKRCGKAFTGKKKDVNKYCSEECYRPPYYINCKHCGSEFRGTPSDKRLFCSFKCYRSFNGETSIETKVRECLDSINNSYIQEHKAANYLIDFAYPHLMIGIECDGTYWHQDSDKETKRDDTLKSLGWNIVHLTEDEINSSELKPLILYNLPQLQV